MKPSVFCAQLFFEERSLKLREEKERKRKVKYVMKGDLFGQRNTEFAVYGRVTRVYLDTCMFPPHVYIYIYTTVLPLGLNKICIFAIL